MHLLASVVLVALLVLAAWRDIATRIIPDEISLSIAAIGIALRLSVGWSPLLWSLATAALLFLALLVLAVRGWLGGGDVKLAAAVAIGLPPYASWDFLLATVLAGGVLGLAYIAGRRLALRPRRSGGRHPFRRIMAVEARRFRQGGPLPYGVAIAAGGALILLASPGL
ncbi:prepilin peptidase CpaA [Humitalea rosea]|uniref:Prepilin peptidase CpaA n=1 Tax=Humitalea rosea TaxID=990373 RepID=A0A2W7IQF7_9PROT|nr:prepilin peptidase [Humitalea rosea]PZW48407.1 prepilin peptidase CpaA [Humitalea rosea]